MHHALLCAVPFDAFCTFLLVCGLSIASYSIIRASQNRFDLHHFVPLEPNVGPKQHHQKSKADVNLCGCALEHIGVLSQSPLALPTKEFIELQNRINYEKMMRV